MTVIMVVRKCRYRQLGLGLVNIRNCALVLLTILRNVTRGTLMVVKRLAMHATCG